jgi:two-component system sensor histidine kinase KdpD
LHPLLQQKGNRPIRALISGALATAGVALMTALIAVLHLDASVANVSMLYLLVVLAAALLLGRFAAILASLEAFLFFDWFFVTPRYQFTVSDPAEWLALCMFLLTATVTGQLTVLLVNRIEEREKSRKETEALAEVSFAVTSELDLVRALDSVLSQLGKVVNLSLAEFIIIQEDSRFYVTKYFDAAAEECQALQAKERSQATNDPISFVIAEKKPIGMDPSEHFDKALGSPAKGAVYQPIIIDERVLGVLHLQTKSEALQQSEQRVIRSMTNLAGLIVQRDRLMKIEAISEAVVKTERLKSALLSMVSHDFKSPLTSIKTSINSLLSEGEPVSPATQRSLLIAVDHETDRLNHLIDNILDLSCLEAGVLSLKLELTPVAELIESALNTMSEEDNRRIDVKLAPEADEVNVDCVLMAQVLRNLLENALKYSPKDARVEMETFAEDGKFLIEVKDRGRGLPKSQESLVFTPFFRAVEVKETSIPGMGLGLALSKGLVEAHQGVLSAYNREAGGAVFRIALPLSPEVGNNAGQKHGDQSTNH